MYKSGGRPCQFSFIYSYFRRPLCDTLVDKHIQLLITRNALLLFTLTLNCVHSFAAYSEYNCRLCRRSLARTLWDCDALYAFIFWHEHICSFANCIFVHWPLDKTFCEFKCIVNNTKKGLCYFDNLFIIFMAKREWGLHKRMQNWQIALASRRDKVQGYRSPAFPVSRFFVCKRM